MPVMGKELSSAGVAEEVRVRMARRKLSQTAVAGRAGMSSSTLSRRLLGESDFTVGELYRIADVLETNVHELLPVAPLKASA
ncbi:hypothetical protein B1R94_26130 [Mycolicibacterium litorale]|nr:hypothetical protein B1R94_26130 [Mycolicibacterium litorale]